MSERGADRNLSVVGTELVWHDGHQRGTGLLVVVHGFAEHPSAALQLGSLLDPGHRYRVCAPVGTVAAGRHKLAFYRSTARMTPDPESFGAAVAGIRSAIVTASDEAGVAPADVVLAGMSQGAGLAAAAALGAGEGPAPGRLILFSGRPYPDDLVAWDFAARAGGRIFAAHGTADRLSPSDAMQAFLARAAAAGLDVTVHLHTYGHTIDADSVATASRWLDDSIVTH